MVCITKIDVPDETTKLMESLGFYQQTAISPDVKWDNLKGIVILHNYQDYPRVLDDVIHMIYCSGFNDGIEEQSKRYNASLKTLTDRFISENRMDVKMLHRADQNLILKGL